MLRRTYKYRLYPTARQRRLLEEQLAFTRDLYNAALEQRIVAYQLCGRVVSHLEQSRQLTRLRRECPEWLPSGMSRSAQQFALRRVEHAFQGFFRRQANGRMGGFPRFKGHRRWDTLACQYGKGAALSDETGRVHWAGVGNVKAKLHRAIPEPALRKQVAIRRQGRHWYVCIACEVETPAPLAKTGRIVGIDLGITTFITLSDGEQIPGPRARRRAQGRVARLQKELARKQRGSKRRAKAVSALARARLKEARIRRDHHFKTARALVGIFDVIYLEDLNIGGLAASVLSKDVSDQAWGQFTRILADKAEEAGRAIVLVNPRNTSQLCSSCGELPESAKPLSQRMHVCGKCGLVVDRDVNAARNVLRLGESRQRPAAEFGVVA